MVKTQTFKYIILQAAIAALSATYSFYPDLVLLLVGITMQIGVYAAISLQKPFWLSLLSPILSYSVAFAITNNYYLALVSLLFFPTGIIVALCIKNNCSRSKATVLTSLSFGAIVALFAIGIIALFDNVSFETLPEKLDNAFNWFTEESINNLPSNYFDKDKSAESYYLLVYQSLRLFTFGVVAFVCNTVAYFSTGITKRILQKTKGNTYLINDKKWLYVLSKPSAIAFIVCNFCILIGGETLTLPQQIAFYSVVIAVLGGVLIMAARSIRKKFSAAGISSIILYFIVLFIFGVPATIGVLSITGIIAAFTYKPKEDNEICKR